MSYKFTILNLFNISIYFSLANIISLASCVPPPTGTLEQAKTARTQYNAGLSNLHTLEKEFSSVINRFTQVAVVEKILNEPPKLIFLDILKEDIDPMLGVYKEGVGGKFNFTPGGFSVAVEFINGVDLHINKITYHPDMRLQGYNLTIASSNREIDTTITDSVTVNIKEIRPDLSQYVPTLLNTGASTIGTYSFSRNANNATVQYEITRRQGTLEVAGLSIQAAKQLRFQELSAEGKPYWDALETIVYLKSELPGVWWGFSATHTYRDSNMGLNVHMMASEQTLATTGLASFRPVKQTSGAMIDGARVARLGGGPYTCNMNITGDIGTGTSIDLVWVDETVETIFPSLKFPCARTVLFLPELL